MLFVLQPLIKHLHGNESTEYVSSLSSENVY